MSNKVPAHEPRQDGARTSLREHQKAFTRARLLEAAREQFVQKGYSSTSVEEIAAAAGASNATFYLHFRAKRDVVLELVDELRQLALAQQATLTEVAEQATPAAVRGWLRTTLLGSAERVPLLAVVEEAAGHDDEVRKGLAAVFEDGVKALSAGMRRGGQATAPDARVRATLVMSLLHGVYREAVQNRALLERDRERTLDVLTRMWMAALAKPH